ncbi:Homogentisate phytyltransferase 1, chloroplastic [Vitis vinifera]|uniref:Homogentisate phytyltransferase 1, chloroplastic n=1 Tax=Vitis vinifera TaxID=29760 RepID=A0A438D486_VITVI|nr:Homogentisate phytyltransferase 1, chloroplastic [Vitis vinifera]
MDSMLIGSFPRPCSSYVSSGMGLTLALALDVLLIDFRFVIMDDWRTVKFKLGHSPSGFSKSSSENQREMCVIFTKGVLSHTNASLKLLQWPQFVIIPVSWMIGSYVPVQISRNGAGRSYTVSFQQHLTKHHVRGIQEGCTFYKRWNTKYVVNAASGQPLESEPGASSPKSTWTPVKNAIDAFYRVLKTFFQAGIKHNFSFPPRSRETFRLFSVILYWGLGVVAALLMNIYIVGLNQISDIEIDKMEVASPFVPCPVTSCTLYTWNLLGLCNGNCWVPVLFQVNKPYLPLASGEYSVGTGVGIVTSFAVMSFLVGWIVGSWPLFWALFVSFVLGTAYSIDLPLLRWKRFALVAAMCILAVRAVIVQIAFYMHVQTFVYGRPAIFSRPLIFATAFMSFFSVVIALFKDIPDIEGTRYSASGRLVYVWVRSGLVFWICILLLEMAYGAAVSVGATSSCLWSKLVTVLGHAVLASILWTRAKSIDLKSKAAITSFYMFIWQLSTSACLLQLFYAEYFLIPLVRYCG